MGMGGRGIAALFDIYRAQFKNTVAQQLQYRAMLVIWLIGAVLEPVVYLVVWATVAGATGGQVGGYSAADFAAYFIILMLVNHVTFTWIAFEFEFRIREGLFSPKLLRPVHPIHADIADNISYKLLTGVLMLPIAGALALLFHPALHTSVWDALAVVPALALAFLLRFLVEWTLALVAFWVTRVNAINQTYYVVLLFLSGQIAPLSLFPAPVQAVAGALPFRWMAAFPIELALGRLTPSEVALGFAAQGAWVLVTISLLAVVWRAGVRRYSAVGA